MKFRTVTAIAIAGALALAPTAAQAVGTYPAPGDSLTCSTTQTPVSTVFTCTIEGPNDAAAQLQTTFSGGDATIAGTVTSAAKTIVDNEATFTVTAPGTTGVIGITGIIDGSAVDTASVEVVAEAGTGGSLSGTGFENAGLALGAGALLVGGAAAIVVAARRRQRVEA